MLSLDGTLPWWRAEESVIWNVYHCDTNSNLKHAWMLSGTQREASPTFLTSLVSMQRSMRSTVEMSMYSLHTSFIHLVKLSTVVSKSSQVNFIMLNTRLMILSVGRDRKYNYLYHLLHTPEFTKCMNKRNSVRLLSDWIIKTPKVETDLDRPASCSLPFLGCPRARPPLLSHDLLQKTTL